MMIIEQFYKLTVAGAGNEELMLTSTPRRSPAVTPTAGTPTGLVATVIESTESVEAKAALKQVGRAEQAVHS